MHGKKNTYQVLFDCEELPFLDMKFSAKDMRGYEIHMGETTLTKEAQALFHITQRSESPVDLMDGFINEKHNVFGMMRSAVPSSMRSAGEKDSKICRSSSATESIRSRNSIVWRILSERTSTWTLSIRFWRMNK
ncbi:Uncharacterised protein [Bacteroides xylanisolvens]|nr:Uncharacterised protein [Bacteroides xylanisolvens]